MPAAHALFGTADAHTAAIVRSLCVCGASGTRAVSARAFVLVCESLVLRVRVTVFDCMSLRAIMRACRHVSRISWLGLQRHGTRPAAARSGTLQAVRARRISARASVRHFSLRP